MNKIIVAMDNSIEDGIALIDLTKQSNEIYGYKIGSMWILDCGVQILLNLKHILAETNKKIILDMQKWGTDIPSIVEKQVLKVAPFVDELIVCPMGGGLQSLKSFANACASTGIKPICVVKMTQPDDDQYLNQDSAIKIYNDAIVHGINSFVVPATKDPISLSFMNVDTIIEKYATGFKAQWGQTTPMVDFGVTKFIVGRAIYESKTPVAVIHKFWREINES